MEFRRLTIEETMDTAVFELLTKWYNDPQYKYYISVNLEAKPMKDKTVDDIIQGIPYKDSQKETYVIVVDGRLVGEVGLDSNPVHVIKKEPATGWLSIIIGEADYQGKGIAQEAITFIEKRALELGLKRMELGVFKSNKRAIRFYEKMGYKAFHVIKDFTYIPDTWTDDIRMEKELV